MLADKWGITREDMDAFSLESHRRAAEAWDSGHFARETISVPIKAEDGSFTGERLEIDEGIRRGGTMETLENLAPAQNWEPDTAPDITAGKSSQTTDGASAMLIAERSVAERLGLPFAGSSISPSAPTTPPSCSPPRSRSPRSCSSAQA